MTKYIVVVGGVLSGVGKGVASASIGKIMKENGFNVTCIKIDPYINCDAGTLRPTEHGEVWVTNDGGETDLDLGNYERFLDISIPKKNNITTGQVFREIIEKEREGHFLGETVQLIPHITDEIKRRIKDSSEGFDVSIIEIGGTVGDYENIPFLFAIKSLEKDIGRDNLVYVLVSYLPIPGHIDEMKTKPTQTAIKLLGENSIEADFILCRGKSPLDNVRKKKIETYANIKSDYVISAPDIIGKDKSNTIYSIPLNFEKEKLGDKLIDKLRLEKKKFADWEKWEILVNKIINPSKKIKIGLIGKYLDIGKYQLKDSYISVSEAIIHAAAHNDVKIEMVFLDSKKLEKDPNLLKDLDLNGIIIPGGFGSSGVEGKINAIKFTRENNIPFLGLCLGLQLSVVEFARNVCNLKGANSTEVNSNTKYPVIDILPEQKNIHSKGGTMRLGQYKAIVKGKVKELYGSEEVYERHRHRYEVNPDYHGVLSEKGLLFSGMSEDNRLVEFIEIPNHKFFIATQAHPEFKSSLMNPSPLFNGFVKACIATKTNMNYL
ncbi:CTP synthase [archaeon BMS3Abin17]|nr:CTP synthase [archaeon BMS3Abin17]HDZ60112.1 CTP synthase (glutamine hydrolyzing) [Candidatus Pacearchaeota archaeon]